MEQETIITPTADQQVRLDQLRRFNRWTIAGPMVVVALIVTLLTGALLWFNLGPEPTAVRRFTSALADIIIILTLVPLLLLCAVVPSAAVAVLVRQRNQKRERVEAGLQPLVGGRIQRLLWRVELLLERIQDRLRQTSDTVARPIIGLNGRLAAVSRILQNLIKRS